MRTIHALALALTFSSLAGCYVEVIDDDRPRTASGDLTLRYDFGGRSCFEAGIWQIDVRLDGVRYGETVRDRVDCIEYEAGLTIENLREDDYEVRIQGLDAMGGVLYASEDGLSLEVLRYTHVEYDVPVPGVGGALTLYWTFDGLGACGLVDEVRVRLFDDDGFVYDDARYPCDFGGVIYDVLGHGVWRVELDGLDVDSRVLFRAAPRNIVVIRGAQNDYTIDLSTYR